MTIVTYAGFSKRPNSTKVPSSGTSRTVTLKQATSVQNPTFILADSVDNLDSISAVSWDGRYYFVNDIQSNHNGITEISCRIDRGATYRSEILATEAFIERCADTYNLNIRDEHVVTTAKSFIENTSGGTLLPSSLQNGVIIVNVADVTPSAASGGTTRIAIFDSASGGSYPVSTLMTALYDSSVIASIEKILAKPYDAIISVRYIPGFTTTNLINSGSFSSSTLLYFGDYAYSLDNVHPSGSGPWTYTTGYEFDLALIEHYTTYEWRNLDPYSNWSMFLPFYGTISIPAEEYLLNNTGTCNLYIKATIDLTTGELIYTRYRRVYISGVATDYVAQEYRTSIGVNIPLQAANHDTFKFATDIVTSAGTAALMLATGGQSAVAGAVAMGASGAGRAIVDFASPSYYTAGSFTAHGTQIATAEPNTIYLTQTGYVTQASPTDYADEIGAPYMQSDTISNHTGFIKCNNASVSMAGTQADKDAVNAMLNSGIFIE